MELMKIYMVASLSSIKFMGTKIDSIKTIYQNKVLGLFRNFKGCGSGITVQQRKEHT